MVAFLTGVEFVPKTSRTGEPRKNPNRRSGSRRGEDKEFIAWDGEGWTEHDAFCNDSNDCQNRNGKCKHHYYLFGCSTGEYASGRSLGTSECFDVMLEAKRLHPDALHVSFSFKYDIDMILRDLSQPLMRYLMKHNRCKFRGYQIEALPGKWFQVGKDDTSIRIYDLFSFFTSSFVSALEKWNVGTRDERESIAAGKSLRSDFTLDSLEETVIPYWTAELRLLALLAERLRTVLYSAGIRPAMWHGPGAVANFLFRDNKTELRMPVYESIPSGVLDASQTAYAGGRFEAFRIGFHDGPVYSADINSAYPYAMSLLPDMATGVWVHSAGDGYELSDDIRVGLFHVRYRYSPQWTEAMRYDGFPGAAHYRYPTSGTVHFRDKNPGTWVHLPEFRNLLEQQARGMFSVFDVIESYVYLDDGTYPFAWVRDIYEQRKEWKAAGNPAQLAAKLGINSLYGKLAQRVGGKHGKPTWHNLEMAGHITSTCRAMLYEASWRQWSDLIAYQTDGVYSTRPLEFLPNGEGDQLGQWEVEQYSGMVHLQSGVYWLRGMDGEWKRPKSRGVPQQHMDLSKAMDALRTGQPLQIEQTQFVRFGMANMRIGGMRYWRTWQRNTREFSFGGDGMLDNGKRVHITPKCASCQQGLGYDEALHTLCLSPKGFPWRNGQQLESTPHYLPWREYGTEPTEYDTKVIREGWVETE